MTADLPRWMLYGDPSVICERIEEMEQRQARQKYRGKGKYDLEQLKELFEQKEKERED